MGIKVIIFIVLFLICARKVARGRAAMDTKTNVQSGDQSLMSSNHDFATGPEIPHVIGFRTEADRGFYESCTRYSFEDEE